MKPNKIPLIKKIVQTMQTNKKTLLKMMTYKKTILINKMIVIRI